MVAINMSIRAEIIAGSSDLPNQTTTVIGSGMAVFHDIMGLVWGHLGIFQMLTNYIYLHFKFIMSVSDTSSRSQFAVFAQDDSIVWIT